jgi:ADP-heptose:LPS heptosyltransferase
MNIKRNCRFFRGDVPCKPHKQHGVHCHDCTYYEKTDLNILIIKLGAIGDVIRTTPLLRKLKEVYPGARIWWLTLTPEVLPSTVDMPLDYSLRSLFALKAMNFDILFNLDKDLEACALVSGIPASKKMGFELIGGKCSPINELANHKFLTGIFDDLNQKNTKSYPQEIFEMCGYEFKGEKYIMDSYEGQYKWDIDKSKKIIGLNTGCGGRWTSRLWKEENWIELAKKLIEKGYQPLFLGGSQEHEKNERMAKLSGGLYPGYFPLKQFINLVNQVDLVITGVTMAMHITIGLNKKIILFNNIFNRNEFELYGLGEIIEPEKKCTCFFSPTCKNTEYKCMDHIHVDKVLQTVIKVIE